MGEINRNTTLYELNYMEEFFQMKNCWIAGWEKQFSKPKSLAELEQDHLEWNADDMVYGIKNLERVAAHYQQYVFHPSGNRRVSLIYVPAEKKEKDSWFLLLAGGAYGSVCTMVESLPVAARLNELGYDCFCLNYSIAGAHSFITGLMPRPLDDLAKSFRFIEKRFQLKAECCFLGGFSAGGHLAGCYALSEIGARRYGLNNPGGLMLVYPLISLNSIENRKMHQFVTTGLFGLFHNQKNDRLFEIHEQLDSSYPRTFYASCRDDKTIPKNNPSLMKNALDKKHIPNRFELYEKGGHGFGLGTIAPGSDYIDRAVLFLEGRE